MENYAWSSPYILAYPMVLIATFWLGLLPGILTWFLDTFGIVYLFVQPSESIFLTNVADVVSLGVFSFLCLALIFLVHYFREYRIQIGKILIEKERLEIQRSRTDDLIQKLSDLNLIGILYFHMDGRILDANAPVLELLGFEADDLANGKLNWKNITPEGWQSADQTAIKQLSEHGYFEPFEKEFMNSDGERVPILLGGGFFKGSREEGMAFVLDLRQQKKLERFQAELTSLIENSDDLFIITDSDGYAIYLNEAAATVLRVSNPDSPGQFNIFSAIQSFDLSKRQPDHYKKLFLSDGFEKDVMLVPSSGGSMIPVHLKSIVISPSHAHSPKHYGFFARNLRNKIESETRLLTALDVAQMAIWEYDIETANHYRSDEHDRLYGFERNLDQWNDDIFYSTLHPSDEAVVRAYFRDIANGNGKTFSIDYRVILPSGDVRWLSTRGRVIQVKGKPSRLVGGVTDVTKIKRSESQLRQALKASEQFLSIASHELKTPVTALQLQMHLVRHHLEDIQKGKTINANELSEVLSEITSQFDRLTHLVNDLLDGTRASNGKLFLSLEEVNLNDLWKAVTRSFRYEPGIKLELDPENELKLIADGHRLHQVITNLVSNAIKFGKSEPIVIRQGLSESGTHIWFEVEDSGIGMSDAEQGNIFKKFGQVYSGRERTGLGLGMYISHEIINAHGGKISVKSAVDKGTTFRVEIPLRPPQYSLLRETSL